MTMSNCPKFHSRKKHPHPHITHLINLLPIIHLNPLPLFRSNIQPKSPTPPDPPSSYGPPSPSEPSSSYFSHMIILLKINPPGSRSESSATNAKLRVRSSLGRTYSSRLDRKLIYVCFCFCGLHRCLFLEEEDVIQTVRDFVWKAVY